jgi:hypothetical protein
MGKRREGFIQRQADQALARSVNGPRKADERRRRDKRMRALLQKAKPPYIPAMTNWLVLQLDKPAHKITAEDVKSVLAKK